jgi:putative membrane-bound dehydrogenase-like protein
MKKLFLLAFVIISLATAAVAQEANAKQKKVVFLAGKPSHAYGGHEHNAGVQLLNKELQLAAPNVFTRSDVHLNGWPDETYSFDGADCIVMYCDGGPNHMVNKHLEQVDALAKKGVGIVCLHYGVEVPKGESGDKFLDWIGGYFEADWSVNPHWDAKFENFPVHPITRGVQPFEINDEWYYHMRFRDGMHGVTPILVALPPASSLSRPDGHHSGNPAVRKAVLQDKTPQVMAWAAERAGGGRGFGFTGGHDHWNWSDPNFRKLVLNAIAWCAHADVPENGLESPAVTMKQLEANMDPKNKPANFDRNKIIEKFKLPPDDANTSRAAPPGPRPAVTDNDPKHQAASAVVNLDVAPGLEVTLFAAEPDIANITNIDIDAKGRIWACDVRNYRWEKRKLDAPPRPEGDRILVLEDTDGDGKSDKQTVFYQGRDIDSAHGVCVLGDRVIISALDKVQVLYDTDGDLKADQADGNVKRDVMFSGIGGAQHDHGIHAFVFGPDGKLYFNMGNEGKQLKDKDGQAIIDKDGNEVAARRQPYQEGLAFRCNFDGSGLQTLGWNFRNNWELAVDSFGTIWQSDNDDDGNKGVRINYVMEYGNYGYKDELTGAAWKTTRENLEKEIPQQHWHLNDPGVVPTMLLTGAGSPTGICVYEGTLLPEVFRNQIIHCDAGPSIVRAYITKKDGAGYKAEIVNILDGAARDNWFRPSDVCVAPDGSLFVSDWYDPGVGGHNQQDTDRGRIFRVAPPGMKYTVPKYDFTTVDGLIEALKSPAISVRYLAFNGLLKQRQGNAAGRALRTAYQATDDPRFKARLIWCGAAYNAHHGQSGDVGLSATLKEGIPELRVMAIRLARLYGLDLSTIASAVKDPSPEVRRELAISLRHSKSPLAANLWADLAAQHDGHDRWYLEALGIGADKQWDAFLDAYLAKTSEPWKTPAGRDIIWRSRAEQTPALLVKIIKDPATKEDEQARYFRALDFLSGSEKEAALKTLLE